MHAPRPYGRLAKGAQPTKADESAAELWARRLTNLKEAGQLDSLRMVRALPDGGYAVAQDMGGVFKVIIHKPETQQPEPPPHLDGLAKSDVPMLFCGTVNTFPALPDKPLRVTFSTCTRKRLNQYEESGRAPGAKDLVRFNVRLAPHLSDFGLWSKETDIEHQAFQVRPTWWSGAMAEVIQIVGGFGRQHKEVDATDIGAMLRGEGPLPDDPIERAVMVLPDAVREDVERELTNVRLPGYFGEPPANGQYQYDFHPENNHGVTFDGAGNPWLLQINARGVFTMPLPVIPATTTRAFRDYVEKNQDTELLTILDRFGGIPSGEPFPTGDDFEAWRRAGVIIRVCDTKQVYDLEPITMATGWAFNSRGTEAYITMIGQDGSARPHVAGFKLRLRFGATPNGGRLDAGLLKPSELQLEVNNYLSGLYRVLRGNSARELAIKYKLRRVQISEIEERARSGRSGESDVDYWDNLELPPIAQHNANCAQVSKGPAPDRLSHFKLPVPALLGCISWDFRAHFSGWTSVKRADTPIFGYYQGDQLKVVKWFYEATPVRKDPEGSFEDVMIVGQWEQTTYLEPTTIHGDLYTSDFDEREEIAERYRYETIKGTDLGYAREDLVFWYLFWAPATLSRTRYFGQVHNTKTYNGVSKRVFAFVPYMQRDMLIYGSKKTMEPDVEREVSTREGVVDPHQYYAWTYDFIGHWAGVAGSDLAGLGKSDWMRSPMPYMYNPPNPVWVEESMYDPRQRYSEKQQWADSGDWLGDLPADYTWLYRITGGTTAPLHSKPGWRIYSWTRSMNAQEAAEFRVFADTPAWSKQISKRNPGDMVFYMSPDPQYPTVVFYADACKLLLGRYGYGFVDVMTDEKVQLSWGYSKFGSKNSSQHFIGVIDE